MPGAVFLAIGTGLVENPGGMFAGSFTTVAELTLSFVFAVCWQAEFSAKDAPIRINKTFLDIKLY